MKRWNWRKVSIGSILTISALPIMFIVWISLEARASYEDYDQMSRCLKGYGYPIVAGWQHQDITLEDFGLVTELSNGEEIELQFLDPTTARRCYQPLTVVYISMDTLPNERGYLLMSDERLQADLPEGSIETVGNLVSQLEFVVEWVEAHPEALSTVNPTDSDALVSILSPSL